jgi:hypothetical protein
VVFISIYMYNIYLYTPDCGGVLLTSGNVGTAGGQDAAGGISSEGVNVVADAGVIGGRAGGVLGAGRVDAGQGTAGDVGEGLGRGTSGEGSDSSDGVLHCGGWVLFVKEVPFYFFLSEERCRGSTLYCVMERRNESWAW